MVGAVPKCRQQVRAAKKRRGVGASPSLRPYSIRPGSVRWASRFGTRPTTKKSIRLVMTNLPAGSRQRRGAEYSERDIQALEPVSYTHLDVYKRQVLLQESKP